MPELVGRFLYFLSHPSEYLGLWTLDATVVFSVVTILVVFKQLSLMREQTSLMKHQNDLMQRQTEIVVRQDDINRELLGRRVKLQMYVEPSPPGQVVVLCRNDGNKTAQNFYWHLAVPSSLRYADIRDVPLDGRILDSTGTESHEGEHYRHYVGLVSSPLYSTRKTPIARIITNEIKLPLWWFTVSEDGADPVPDGTMQRIIYD